MQERDKGFKTRLGGSADLHNYFNYLKININKQAEKRGGGGGGFYLIQYSIRYIKINTSYSLRDPVPTPQSAKVAECLADRFKS